MEKGPVFGLNIGDLLTIYDHDSQSWKMSECLFTGDLAKYLEALPKSGIMQNGKIYEQRTWVRRTKGRESGLWPTPIKEQAGTSKKTLEMVRQKKAYLTLDRAVLMEKLPTPTAQDHRETDGQMRPSRIATGRKTEYLNRTVKAMEKFPTPQARDWKGKSQRGNHGNTTDCLPNAVANYPTPTAQDYRRRGPNSKQQGLPEKVHEPNSGQLNPQWVDWLMGYPVGWTDLKDSEMQLSLK